MASAGPAVGETSSGNEPGPEDRGVGHQAPRTLHGAVASDDVALVQLALSDAGFDPGQTDGVYGPATAAAVRDFQSARNLDADGIVDEATWRALAAEPEAGRLRQARFTERLHGATGGADVLDAQRALADLGFDPGELDGIYGPHTAAAVQQFQRARGLDADGVIGPETWAALGELPRDELRLLATALEPGRSAPLAVALTNERAVAILEVEPGALGGVDVATGERVWGPFRASPPVPSADDELRSGDVGPPQLATTGDGAARPSALTVTSGPDGPVVVSVWSDGFLRCWSLASGEPVGVPQPAALRLEAPLTAVEVAGTIYIVGQGESDEVHVFRQWPNPSSWTLHGGEGVTRPVVFALDGRPAIAVIARDITPHGILRMFLEAPDRFEERPEYFKMANQGETLTAEPADAAAAGFRPLESIQGADHAFERLLVGGAPDAPVLVTRSPAGLVEQWRGDDGTRLSSGITADGDDTRHLAVTERMLVVAGAAGPIHRYELGIPQPTGQVVRFPEADKGGTSVAALAAADEGDRSAIAVLDTAGNLWGWTAGPVGRAVSEWRQPNPNLARDYWTTDDNLGYGDYAQAIADFVQHDNTKPPLTIGIKGPWGAGKTSVMRMVQRILDPPLDPNESEWRFRKLNLTTEGKEALTKGASGVEVAETTVKTVLDRCAAAPVGELDLGTQAEAPADHTDVIRPTVWFNPWMYQTGEQLWAGLAHEIITQITGRLPRGQRERFWLELNLRRVNREALRRRIYGLLFQKLVAPLAVALGGVLLGVVLALANVSAAWLGTAIIPVLGGTLAGIRSTSELLRRDAAGAVPSMVEGPIGLPGREDLAEEVGSWGGLIAEPDYQTRAGFLYFVQTDMKHVLDLVATPGRPLVVFIDDLDRCSPGVVTQTIEAVNLFLAGQFPNCIFVLAIEPAVVAAHIETANRELVAKLAEFDVSGGWERLGWRFLEKIVQLPLALPQPRPGLARDYVLSLFGGSGSGGEIDGQGGGPGHPDDGATQASEIQEAVKDELEELEKREAKPTLSAIPHERRQVEERLRRGRGFDDAAARRIADEVAIRRFANSYSDDDDEVRRVIVNEALALPNRNPRDMKRLVNLFRFYALIVNQRRVLVEARSQSEVFEQVARLAALTNRWPHLLNVLGAPGEPTGGSGGERRVALEELEDAASGPDGKWDQALKDWGLAGGAAGRPEPEGLRKFLTTGPRIGTVARELL